MHLFHCWGRFQCKISQNLDDRNRDWCQWRSLWRVYWFSYRGLLMSLCALGGVHLSKWTWADGMLQPVQDLFLGENSTKCFIWSHLWCLTHTVSLVSHTKQHLLGSWPSLWKILSVFGEHYISLPSLCLCLLLDLVQTVLPTCIQICFQAFVGLALLGPVLHHLLNFM